MAKQLTTSPTRTVAGSYQAPVEGIVDYGAFQKGFESTFKLPKKPKPLTDEFDSSVDGLSAQEGIDINFEGTSIRTLNKTIRTGFGLDNLSKQAGIARRDGDVQTFNQINERLARIIDGRNGAETLLKTSANYFNASNQRGATQFARAESGRGLYADGLAESISKGNATFGFGKDENGNEVAGLYVRNYNVDFKGESKEAIFGQAKETISQVESKDFDIKSKIESKARPTMTADDFFIPTEGLTEENLINRYFPPRADLQDNFAEINNEANLDNFKITADDILEVDTSNQYKSTKTGNIITSDSEEKIVSERGYKKIDFAANSAANQVAFSDKYNENKEALYQDAVFGESGERITVKTPIGKYILGFGADGFMGYKAEDFKKVGANGKIGGDIPLNIKNELVKQYSIDKYKVQFGEGAYYYNENGHAVKSAIPVDTKTTSRLDLTAMRIGEGAGQFLTQMGIKATDGTLNRANIMNQKQWFASTNTQREDYIRNLNTIASPESGSRFLDKDQAKQAFYESNSELETEEIDKLWKDKINQFSEKVGGKLVEPVIWNIKGNDLKGVDFGYSPTGAFSIALDAAGIRGEKRLQYLSEVKKQLANNDYN